MTETVRTIAAVTVALLALVTPVRAQGTAPSGPPGAGVPHLEIDKDTIDLGEIVRGGKAEATFVLRNTGSVPLHVLSARPG